MNRRLPILALFALVLVAGCQTLFTGTITLTGIVDDASKEYASAFNKGLVPADVAQKAAATHLEYRRAAGIAADALTAYKLGQTADVKGTLEAARVAASHFIDVLVPLLTKQKAATLKMQVQKAGGV